MTAALLISVRFHEGWYHAFGNTPSPARIFQALVAGAGVSGPLDDVAVSSLLWLEQQKKPPIVAVPSTTRGQSVVNYVPNNDLDSKNGDHRRIGEIRVKKSITPLLFNPEIPFLFAWCFDEDATASASLEGICRLADRIYQVGRTVDIAWAWAELLSLDELHERLNSYPGVVRHPVPGLGDVECPTAGSLDSLNRRYSASASQFDTSHDRRGQTFRRRPKPKWRRVSYAGTGSQVILELRRRDDAGFLPWPLERTSELAIAIRDRAVGKLRAALPDRIPEIDRVFIGRRPNGENNGPTSARVRILPLPSIGHPHADMLIRRLLIDIPGECPIRPDDIVWAISGLQLAHPVLREPIDVTRSIERSQLKFYGVEQAFRLWRTVTPVSLPEAIRRRIDPVGQRADAKSGNEKYREHVTASFAVGQALRRAGIGSRLASVRVQREPFDLRGMRVEPFAQGTRFNKHCLWHVEVELESPIRGPLVIGDGRFSGLGLMRPVQEPSGIFAFLIESGLNPNPDPIRVARSLRRAVMARTRDVLGTYRLPAYFSGHRSDGTPARAEDVPHLAFIYAPHQSQLLVIAPELLDRRIRHTNGKHLATLESALQNFDELRAGADGHLQIRRTSIDVNRHRLFAPSHIWESVTPYQVNRHARQSTAQQTLKNDLLADCERRGLPRPEITVLEWFAQAGVGLQGRLRLIFKEATEGPIILGKTRHKGGGIFSAVDSPTA